MAEPTAQERVFALNSLEHSLGWRLFLEQHAKNLRAIEEKALDPATPDEETRHLKHVRRYLLGERHPANLLTRLASAAENEARKQIAV